MSTEHGGQHETGAQRPMPVRKRSQVQGLLRCGRTVSSGASGRERSAPREPLARRRAARGGAVSPARGSARDAERPGAAQRPGRRLPHRAACPGGDHVARAVNRAPSFVRRHALQPRPRARAGRSERRGAREPPARSHPFTRRRGAALARGRDSAPDGEAGTRRRGVRAGRAGRSRHHRRRPLRSQRSHLARAGNRRRRAPTATPRARCVERGCSPLARHSARRGRSVRRGDRELREVHRARPRQRDRIPRPRLVPTPPRSRPPHGRPHRGAHTVPGHPGRSSAARSISRPGRGSRTWATSPVQSSTSTRQTRYVGDSPGRSMRATSSVASVDSSRASRPRSSRRARRSAIRTRPPSWSSACRGRARRWSSASSRATRQVAGGGELTFWNEHAPAWVEAETDKLAEAASRLRRGYLQLLHGIRPDAARVTDKMPFNFLWIGLVHILFPRARIVHCRRNPVDTCLSIYSTLFAQQLGLRERPRRPRLLLSSVPPPHGALARACSPADRLLDVDYEDVTAAPDRAAQQIVAFSRPRAGTRRACSPSGTRPS